MLMRLLSRISLMKRWILQRLPRRKAFGRYSFQSNRREEFLQMPKKMPKKMAMSIFRHTFQAVPGDSGRPRGRPALRDRRNNGSIDVRSGATWRIAD